jgi:hypothetical protein
LRGSRSGIGAGQRKAEHRKGKQSPHQISRPRRV